MEHHYLGEALVLVIVVVLVAGFLVFSRGSGLGEVTGFVVTFPDDGTCPLDQTVYKMSALDNAHAELYSEGNYNVEVCAGEEITSRDCTGIEEHVVLWLSDI